MSAGEGEADDTVGAGVPEDSSVFTEGTDIQDYVCAEVMTARVFVERRPIRGRNRRSSLNCERVAEDLVRGGVSSPPLNAAVLAPKASALPNARTPPVTPTLPIVFALLCDAKLESTVSAPPIVSEHAFSNSAV